MNQQSELVSIIMPAFRADTFLGETLRRVAEQSYDHWELMVVEDASAGETESIVQEFADRHPTHRVVYRRHEQNKGPSASRNTALAEARGDLIALLDADDLWLPDHLQVSVEELRKQTSDLVYSTPVLFDDKSGFLLGIWGANEEERAHTASCLFRRNFITPFTVVMRRSVIDTVGPFDETAEIQGCEDLDYWLRCVRAQIRFACLPGCHGLYRKGHPQAATTQINRIAIRHTLVLEKHLGMAEIPLKVQRCHLGQAYKDAASRNFRDEPMMAASLFYKAWRAYPRRIDNLARMAMAVCYGCIRTGRRG